MMDTELLKKLSKMELISLNHKIIEELKCREEASNKTSIDNFKVGDKVEFVADEKELFGIVIRVNRKTITIDSYGFGQWRVSPQLVRNLTAEVSSKKNRPKNVVPLQL